MAEAAVTKDDPTASAPSETSAPPTATPDARPSELAMSDAWDRAIETGIKWAAYGLLAGGAVGVLLFRGGMSRSAVTGLGTGVGIGMAYADARREFADLAAHTRTDRLSVDPAPRTV